MGGSTKIGPTVYAGLVTQRVNNEHWSVPLRVIVGLLKRMGLDPYHTEKARACSIKSGPGHVPRRVGPGLYQKKWVRWTQIKPAIHKSGRSTKSGPMHRFIEYAIACKYRILKYIPFIKDTNKMYNVINYILSIWNNFLKNWICSTVDPLPHGPTLVLISTVFDKYLENESP